MALKELQQGDPRIEQYSARVAIANSQAEQLKAAGVEVQRQKPEEQLLGGSRWLDEAFVFETNGNFKTAIKWYSAGAYRIRLALEELQQTRDTSIIEHYTVLVAIANSRAEQLKAGEMKTCKLRGSCTNSVAVVGGSGGKAAAVDAVLSSLLQDQ